MRIVNLNPDSSIGASAWFVNIEDHRILMDSGIHPKREGRAALPLFNLIKGEVLDAIAITHCHHDHVGSLPVAVRHFPGAHVIMTELSYFIVERVLHNSVNVMKSQRDELGIQEYPLYSHEEVEDIAPIFQGFKYDREIDWAHARRANAGYLAPSLEFYDAGHALGSAGIMLRGNQETLFYSGDVCFHDQTILKRARFEDVEADVMILETTRGNRELPPNFSRAKEVDRLVECIEQVHARGGSVLLPSFALGRTQEVLALLSLLTAEGRLRPQPIYIGGLGRVFTEIYDLQAHRTHRQYPNLQLHEALNLEVLERAAADTMNLGGGKIFVITAGMMSENTATHNLALRMAGDSRHGIFFVGYTDPDSPGGRLNAAVPGVPFHFSDKGGELVRHCQVENFDLTAHANREDLLDFVGRVQPKVVLLGHGEDSSRNWMQEQIQSRFKRIKVIQPRPGQTIEL